MSETDFCLKSEDQIPELMALIGEKLESGTVEISIVSASSSRTAKQNRSLHLGLGILAGALNGAGFDMKRTLKADVDIPWTKALAKEYLYKPLLKAMKSKASTKDASTVEVGDVWKVMIDHLVAHGKLDQYIPFPNRFEQ